MTLIALTDEQREVLKHWLHYIRRKMEFHDTKLDVIISIQEQVLRPKKFVTTNYDSGSVDGEILNVSIDKDTILINID